MPWVVKAWKPDLLDEAERELRRMRAEVRRARRELPPAAAQERGQTPFLRTSRVRRASLRESPLGELFRSTG